jgi:hypothetical protein
MRRTRNSLQPLMNAFSEVPLDHPIHSAILVGVTDDEGPDYFEVVPNDEGFFQVLAGCRIRGTDEALIHDVFDVLQRAVRLCPFAIPDHEKLDALFARLKPSTPNNP